MTPDRREDVVQLDVDGGEREEASHCHLRDGLPVPWQRRDLARVLVGARGRVPHILAVLAADAAEDGQGEGNHCPDDDDDADRAKGEGGRGTVEDGDRVEEAEHGEERGTEEAPRQDVVSDPVRAPHDLVVARGHIARNPCRQRVQDHERCQQRPPVVRVEHPNERKREDTQRHHEDLGPASNNRTEQVRAGREAEHIAMDILPPRLLLLVKRLVIPCVLHEVVLQHTHENGPQKARKKKHSHTAVDDGEPVDL
mmetsp:Transcript_35637/g.84450  ORF Transcript_35637/g.84450 Transcript_35637/m.84450 type:complete len:254 (+) Transcript_35637:552-1313(+)